MKKVTYLTAHNGELQNTAHKIVEVWNEKKHSHLLSETKTALVSSSMWQPVTVKKYGKTTIEIPDWMDPAEFPDEIISWSYYIGQGANPEWPRQWYNRLKAMDEVTRYAAVKLLNTNKFRSEFRQSLRNQLENWLNDKDPTYSSPFSRKQWDCILNKYIRREAKQVSTKIYWSH